MQPDSFRAVAGIGAKRGISGDEAEQLLRQALDDAGLRIDFVRAVATIEAKADEQGLIELSQRIDVPLITYSALALAAVAVVNPSERVRAAVGTPSVAEAAALLAAQEYLGDAGTSVTEFVVTKTTNARATIAIARPSNDCGLGGLGPA
jgi:cobalt-precorrin 5A hydrolase/precorrin-3B C17-methyltransferase